MSENCDNCKHVEDSEACWNRFNVETCWEPVPAHPFNDPNVRNVARIIATPRLPDLDEVEWDPLYIAPPWSIGQHAVDARIHAFPVKAPTPAEKVAKILKRIQNLNEWIVVAKETIEEEEYSIRIWKKDIIKIQAELEVLTQTEDFPLIPVKDSEVML